MINAPAKLVGTNALLSKNNLRTRYTIIYNYSCGKRKGDESKRLHTL